MKQLKTTFQPLDAQRLQEMASLAVSHRQRVPLFVALKRRLPQATSPWALAPVGAFAAVVVLLFALYAGPSQTTNDDLIAQVEQTDLLVMLEENLY